MVTTRIRLLLVEDNPGDARLMRELLADAAPPRFDVVHVDCLRAALAALRDGQGVFDAVLLDLSLPDGEGLNTVMKVQEAVTPSPPIVVLTGRDDQEIALRAVQLGAQDYLLKDRVDGALLDRSVRYAIERDRLIERERRAMEQRDRVLAMVTHDLRSPLSAIIMGLELELDRGGIRDKAEARIGAVVRTAERMNRLLRDLLDTVSLEAGHLSIEPRPYDAAALVHEVAGLLGPELAERELSLSIEIPDGLPRILVDADRMAQVLSNLLSNAVRFTEEGGRVGVQAEPGRSMVRVSVWDTGSGIPAADREHLFDRFWKPRSSRRNGGTGLGLAIAQGIVETHGGRIWLESVVGEGSTFHFTVPVTDGAGA